LEALESLKRASVGALWEIVGGAASAGELVRLLDEHQPDVVVIDARLGDEVITRVRDIRPAARIVSLGPSRGVDAEAATLDEVRSAVMAVPAPGGPVRL
jgi:DNA-binding NarL/FixJ family response regulator